MKLFDVYPLFDIEPVRGLGAKLWDKEGDEYLDLYGGHAVISIGHSHPLYVESIKEQVQNLGFYSNSVINNLQHEYAALLEEVSGCQDYELFFCNSGAEANENALKVASFDTNRSKVIAMKKAFHGRTSGVVATTDNQKIVAPFNAHHEVVFVEMNNEQALEEAMDDEVAAVLIEGIQGVAGIYEPTTIYLQKARTLCDHYDSKLILDEVQSGFGRTGQFFAFQHHGIRPDIITMGKGMGNGFPLAGLLIDQNISPWKGMLGTTFGGNHLACAAGLAVLEVIQQEGLMQNARVLGQWLHHELSEVQGILELRGNGLMLAIELEVPVAALRKELLETHKIFTGSSANPNTLRILPPLSVKQNELESFIKALKEVIQ